MKRLPRAAEDSEQIGGEGIRPHIHKKGNQKSPEWGGGEPQKRKGGGEFQDLKKLGAAGQLKSVSRQAAERE